MTKLEELLELNHISKEDSESHTEELAEDAFLLATYNSILIEMMMEDE